MRAIFPLAMMVVPGAAYAQAADLVTPIAPTPLSDQVMIDHSVLAADFSPFAEPLSFDAAEAQPAETLLPTVAFATALSEAAVVETVFAPAVSLADVADVSLVDAAEASDAGLPTLAAAEEAILVTASLADAADAEAVSEPVALADQLDALFAGGPVSEDVLAESKGMAADGSMFALVNNSGNVNNNYIGNNSQTGDVNVANSFGNSSGFSMVNINTGNQSIINAGMSVNMQVNYTSSGQ